MFEVKPFIAKDIPNASETTLELQTKLDGVYIKYSREGFTHYYDINNIRLFVQRFNKKTGNIRIICDKNKLQNEFVLVIKHYHDILNYNPSCINLRSSQCDFEYNKIEVCYGHVYMYMKIKRVYDGYAKIVFDIKFN